MAIIGLGIDIVEIKRITKVVESSGERLALRILSILELKQYQLHHQKIRFLAKRFAVKEAATKAFGIGFRSGLAFNQFEVYNTKLGKPSLRFFYRAADFAKSMGINNIHITLSDERYYACAIVILEK